MVMRRGTKQAWNSLASFSSVAIVRLRQGVLAKIVCSALPTCLYLRSVSVTVLDLARVPRCSCAASVRTPICRLELIVSGTADRYPRKFVGTFSIVSPLARVCPKTCPRTLEWNYPRLVQGRNLRCGRILFITKANGARE